MSANERAQHTPGPWEMWGEPTHDDPSCKIVSGHAFVATTIGDNDLANARLIAAAPDLLEALRSALIAFDAYEQAGIIVPRDEAQEKMRTAVARAEGR